MRLRRWWGKIIPILLALAILPGFARLQGFIAEERIVNDLVEPFRLTGLRDLPVQTLTGTLFTGVLSGFRGVVVDILWMKVDAAWDLGRNDLMVPLLDAITMLDPRFLDAWEMLAWHHAYNLHAKEIEKHGQWDWGARLGSIEDGLRVLERGVRWNPTQAQLYWFMGAVYGEKMGDFEKAAEWWEKAYECADHLAPNARMVAHAYEDLPDFDKALYWYYVAEKEDPGHPTPPGAVMTIRERYLPAWEAYKRGNLEEAKRLVEQTLEDYNPTNEIALHLLATILEAQGQYKEALEKWEFSFATHPLDAMALRKAYELREKLGIPQPSSEELEDKWWLVAASPRS